MLKWLSIAPLLLLAGCSKSDVATSPAGSVGYAQPSNGTPVAAAPAGARPVDAYGQPMAPAPGPVSSADRMAPGAPVGTVIPNGTPLHVRVDETIDTRRNRAGDGFTATLARPVELDGRVLLPEGTQFTGHVTNAHTSGRMKGRASLGLALDGFQVNGRQYRIETTSVDRVSSSHKKRNAWLIGGGGALGAGIGALAGGGKGALIGAGAGAGAGTGAAALTGKKEVGIGAETPLRFTLRTDVAL